MNMDNDTILQYSIEICIGDIIYVFSNIFRGCVIA